MNRRELIRDLCAAAGLACAPRFVFAAPASASANYQRLLVLVEFKGGNDGLNTVVPYADPEYLRLRPRIGVRREEVLQLDERTGFHPSLAPLMSMWQGGELAVVQGVGYPKPNLSHFRSIEIWDTASHSDQYLGEGWLARAFAQAPVPANFAAEGIALGGQESGPLAGTRSIAFNDPEQFLRRARLAKPMQVRASPALAHVLKVEADVAHAAGNFTAPQVPQGAFPQGELGNALRVVAQVLASGVRVAAVKVSLNGFDTHQNQPGIHANLLRQFAEALVAFRQALQQQGRWESTLVMSYSEFGRRPAENGSSGTDHGTANTHFVTGGLVKGGLHGAAPELSRLDNGNLVHGLDFRNLYATALGPWWGLGAGAVDATLGGRYQPADLIRSV